MKTATARKSSGDHARQHADEAACNAWCARGSVPR